MAFKNLQEECIETKIKIKNVDTRYGQASLQVQEIADKYARCKSHSPIQRYAELRNMIKECNTYYDVDKMDDVRRERGIGGAAEAFRDNAKELRTKDEIKHEIEKMKKDELKKYLEVIKGQLAKTNRNLNEINRDVENLKREYQESKSDTRITKYRKRKRMLKSFIRKHPKE